MKNQILQKSSGIIPDDSRSLQSISGDSLVSPEAAWVDFTNIDFRHLSWFSKKLSVLKRLRSSTRSGVVTIGISVKNHGNTCREWLESWTWREVIIGQRCHWTGLWRMGLRAFWRPLGSGRRVLRTIWRPLLTWRRVLRTTTGQPPRAQAQKARGHAPLDSWLAWLA